MKRFPHLMLAIMIGLVLFTTAACDSTDNTEADDVLTVTNDGYTNINGANLSEILAALPKEPLSAAEIAGVQFMREEEKLAHDVYVVLFEKWGKPVFNNISASELTHTEAVYALIDKYDLEDPVKSSDVGVFTNTVLQELYNTLVEQGTPSLVEALRVGAAIEEIDIRDLERELDQNVDNADITMVYENLMKGSRNHLRAFVRNLAQQGITYVPQYLDQADYAAIINSPMERG